MGNVKPAELSGWHSPKYTHDITEITISAINKQEAIKFVKKNYPRFKYYYTFSRPSKTSLGLFKFNKKR